MNEASSPIKSPIMETDREYSSRGVDDEIALSESADGIEVEASPEVVRRISVVELQLQDFMDHQRQMAEDEAVHILPRIEMPGDVSIFRPHAYPCATTYKRLPAPPTKWPQAPVMLRPTPGSGTKIRGIRHADSSIYQHFTGFCAGCILPVNTGSEMPGKSLVIDFESDLFVGTLLMRIKDVTPIQDAGNYRTDESYFDGKKRKFQAIVRGKFKSDLPMSECVTGQVFERPAGKLPARFVVNTFIKFVSTLAPQLEVTLSGNQPRFITPLVATAHTVLVLNHETISRNNVIDSTTTLAEDDDTERLVNYQIYAGSTDMERDIHDPPEDDPTSILPALCAGDDTNNYYNYYYSAASATVASRMKNRKKAFNRNAANRDKEPRFALDKEYCFEFYQHLLLFVEPGDLKLDLGRALGHAGLSQPLNGQPLKFMAAHKSDNELKSMWSFDIWHQAMYSIAQTADTMKTSGLKK
jgi:Protein of unknown function (DUF1769)